MKSHLASVVDAGVAEGQGEDDPLRRWISGIGLAKLRTFSSQIAARLAFPPYTPAACASVLSAPFLLGKVVEDLSSSVADAGVDACLDSSGVARPTAADTPQRTSSLWRDNLNLKRSRCKSDKGSTSSQQPRACDYRTARAKYINVSSQAQPSQLISELPVRYFQMDMEMQ